jgi:hypothetical protein
MAAPGPTSAYYEQVLGELAADIEALDASAYARTSGDRWRVLRTGTTTDPRHLTAAILPAGTAEQRGAFLHLGLTVQWWAQLDGADALRDVARVLAASRAIHGLLRGWAGSQGERLVTVEAAAPERSVGFAQYGYDFTLITPF